METFLIICERSQSERFTQRILKNIDKEILSKAVKKIVYAYFQWQPTFQEIRDYNPAIIFYEGLPSKEEMAEWAMGSGELLLILDDLVYRVIQSFDYMELFTIHVHHMNISVIFISQNLFPQGKYSRVISLNCQYLVLSKNPRDNFQVKYLATQLYPNRTPYFLDAYEKATQKPYSYLLVDLTVSGKRDYSPRTAIFPGDLLTVYMRKDMNGRLRRNWAFLNLLATASPRQRQVLLETISQKLKIPLEVIYNVIHNREIIPSDSFIKNLYKYSHILRCLAKKKGKNKKSLVLRRHGFLPVSLKPLLPELAKYVY